MENHEIKIEIITDDKIVATTTIESETKKLLSKTHNVNILDEAYKQLLCEIMEYKITHEKLKKVMISFPQIVIQKKEVNVTNEEYEVLIGHSCISEKADFIWNNLTEQEKDWTQGKKWIEDAIDCEYCGIKDIKDNKSTNKNEKITFD